MKALVIGSGIAGLAVAIRLRIKGYQVVVFESTATLGGKAGEWTQDGFRFDLGPSLLTLPHLIDDLFELAGKDPKNYFDYQKLPVICRYFWEDGTQFDTRSDHEKMIQSAQDKFSVSPQNFRAYLDESARQFNLTCSTFLEHSLHLLSTWTRPEVWKALKQIHRLHLFSTMNERNRKLLRDPHLVQLFDRYATYNGSSPYQASALFNLISYPEFHDGAFFPTQGIRSIPNALIQLGKELGVNYRTNENVESILTNSHGAKGVITSQGTYHSDVVVSNMDIHSTYKKLLPDQKMPRYVKRSERSSSAYIFYWGMRRVTPELDLHNIFFSENYREEFRHLFKLKKLYSDPTIYVHISQKQNPQDAPDGMENWFVMINAPSSTHKEAPPLSTIRQWVIDKLQRQLNFSPLEYLVYEKVRTPEDLQYETQSHLGSLYGTSSNHLLSAFRRHPNFSKKIPKLYFCGGSVHPGGGIPLCLYSAKITASLIPHV